MRFIGAIFFLFVSLHAMSSYDKGKELYMEKGCFGCHGVNAEGMHNYPWLANRAKGFLAYKLKRFRDKISDNQQQEMMIPFAVNLSDADIEHLTTFLNEFVPPEQKNRYDDSYQIHGDGGS